MLTSGLVYKIVPSLQNSVTKWKHMRDDSILYQSFKNLLLEVALLNVHLSTEHEFYNRYFIFFKLFFPTIYITVHTQFTEHICTYNTICKIVTSVF